MDLAYDDLGRITNKTETVQGVTTGHEYVYNASGRLAEVFEGAGDCQIDACSLVASYGYDPNGNRLVATGSGVGVYDAQDRLISRGAAGYTYTDAGELLTKTLGTETTTYAYDVREPALRRCPRPRR